MTVFVSRPWVSTTVALALGLTGLLAQAAPPKPQADSQAREAVAARQAAKQGQLSSGSAEQLSRNAVARCTVFKSEEDRRACVDRVTQGQSSGSVAGGGVLTEYTYTVPAKP